MWSRELSSVNSSICSGSRSPTGPGLSSAPWRSSCRPDWDSSFPRSWATWSTRSCRTAVRRLGSLDRYGLILLVVLIVQAVFNYLRVYQLALVGEGVVADIRRAVFDRVVRLPVPFFDRNLTGDVTSRLTSDAAAVQHTVSSTLAQVLSQGITLVGGVILLVLISPVLSLTVLTFLPIVIIAGAIFGRRLRRISADFQDHIAEANSLAHESISAIRVVKWFSGEGAMTQQYDRDIAASYRTAIRRARLSAIFMPAITFVGFSTIALVLWVGGRLVARGDLTAGELVTFLLYTLTVAGAIASFTGLYTQVQNTLGASQRVFELLGEAPEVADVPRTRGARERSRIGSVGGGRFRLRRARHGGPESTSTSKYVRGRSWHSSVPRVPGNRHLSN